MGTSISFPYNQTVQAFTPTSGTYANNTFVISASSNGIGAGQIQPSSSSSNGTSYQCSFPYNINAGGNSTSTLAFILNEQNGGVNQNPPYYFVTGSTGENLWLYSFTPASSASSFGSGNISEVEKIDSFDTQVASVLYYPPLNLLFVGGNNGNLYTYQVSWNSQGVPSFSYQGANKNYSFLTGCAVSLTLAQLPNPSSYTTPNPTNKFNQYVPVGSYQNSASDISITINANLKNTSGQTVPSTLTYTTSQATSISDISNNNGTLTIVSGNSTTPNPTNKFNQYVPVGSYQNSASDISITINAELENTSGQQGQSTLTYTTTQSNYLNDICNNNGQLATAVGTTPNLIVTGLSLSNISGSFVFPISSSNNGILPNGTYIGGTTDSVATVVDYQNALVYTATQTSLVSNPITDLPSTATVIWNASNESQLILSLAGSSNPKNVAPQGKFSKGALFIGTVPASSGAAENTKGSIYTYDPTSSSNGGIALFQSSMVDGSPYSLYSDQNLHLLVNAGSTGLYYYSVSYNESTPESAALIPNIISTSSGFNLGRLLAEITLEYVLIATAEIDPIALGLAIATLATT